MKLKLNFEVIREDIRKLGLVLTGGGFIGLVVDSDKITMSEGFIISSFGLIIWIISVIMTPSLDEED